MVDYKKALAQGAQALEHTAGDRQEVDRIFDELFSTLRSVGVEPAVSTPLAELGMVLNEQLRAALGGPHTVRDGWRLCKVGREGREPKVLFRFKKTASGFPVFVAWQTYQHICDGGEPLEQAFEAVLADPRTSEILQELGMELPQKQHAGIR